MDAWSRQVFTETTNASDTIRNIYRRFHNSVSKKQYCDPAIELASVYVGSAWMRIDNNNPSKEVDWVSIPIQRRQEET